MSLNVLGRWRSSQQNAARHGRRTPTRRCPLRLESLEDRSVPATFTVNTTLDEVTPADGKLSLREAITRANTTPGADVIVLPAGVLRSASPRRGGRQRDRRPRHHGYSEGPRGRRGPHHHRRPATRPHVRRDRHHSQVDSGCPSRLDGPQRAGDGHGGGVRVGNADLVVRDCVVAGNRASGTGGGVSNIGLPGTGNITVVRTTVARNVAGLTAAALTDPAPAACSRLAQHGPA